jgi:hypothetical protein
MKREINELEKLLKEGAEIGSELTSQRTWAAMTKRLIDSLLGPSPINIHSEAFYEFDFAKSHEEKLAILKAIVYSVLAADNLAISNRLESLVEDGVVLTEESSQMVWAAEVKRLLDFFLGPSPINIHSEAFYEFGNAKSHEEKIAILKAILISDIPDNSTLDVTNSHKNFDQVIQSNLNSDIFLSHVEEDQGVALTIADLLMEAGYKVWCYERNAVPGLSYLVQTGEAIVLSQAILLLISTHSLSSHQIDIEVERAHEENKPFIPIRLGISHVEYQNRRPLWRQAIGTTASIELTKNNIGTIVQKIVNGLISLKIFPKAIKEPTNNSKSNR